LSPESPQFRPFTPFCTTMACLHDKAFFGVRIQWNVLSSGGTAAQEDVEGAQGKTSITYGSSSRAPFQIEWLVSEVRGPSGITRSFHLAPTQEAFRYAPGKVMLRSGLNKISVNAIDLRRSRSFGRRAASLMGFSMRALPQSVPIMCATEVAHPDASRKHRDDHFERRLEILCLTARSPGSEK